MRISDVKPRINKLADRKKRAHTPSDSYPTCSLADRDWSSLDRMDCPKDNDPGEESEAPEDLHLLVWPEGDASSLAPAAQRALRVEITNLRPEVK